MDTNLIQNKSVNMGAIADAAYKMLHGKSHALGRLIVIDYEANDSGEIQLHIFPNVPDHNQFYPNNQAFAKILEDTVRSITPNAVVEAEFHEEDGILTEFDEDGKPYEKKADTRVKAYYRKEDGTLTSIVYPQLVPMVWLRITDIPGSFYPRDKTARALAESIVAASERIS